MEENQHLIINKILNELPFYVCDASEYNSIRMSPFDSNGLMDFKFFGFFFVAVAEMSN